MHLVTNDKYQTPTLFGTGLPSTGSRLEQKYISLIRQSYIPVLFFSRNIRG